MIGRVSAALRRFLVGRAGAVSVDWVVLTAAVVGLGLAAVGAISGGTEHVARAVDAELSSSSQRPPAGGSGGTQTAGTTGGNTSSHQPVYDDQPNHDPATGGGSDPGETSAGGSGGTSGGSDAGSAGSETGSDGNGADSGQTGHNSDTATGSDSGSGSEGATSGSGGGAGGGSNDTPPAEQVDFTFDDLDIGCWWSERAVSNWMTFNFPANTPFTMRGEGNPTAQDAQGHHESSGEVRWGTNIRVDIPAPGASRTVYMEVGDRVGSFTVTRAACP